MSVNVHNINNNNKKMAAVEDKKSKILDLIVKSPGIRYRQLMSELNGGLYELCFSSEMNDCDSQCLVVPVYTLLKLYLPVRRGNLKFFLESHQMLVLYNHHLVLFQQCLPLLYLIQRYSLRKFQKWQRLLLLLQ